MKWGVAEGVSQRLAEGPRGSSTIGASASPTYWRWLSLAGLQEPGLAELPAEGLFPNRGGFRVAVPTLAALSRRGEAASICLRFLVDHIVLGDTNNYVRVAMEGAKKK